MKTPKNHRRWRGVACNARCSLDIFSSVCQTPEGRRENSPGLQPWECVRKEKRPERAADCRALFPRMAFVESDSIRPPFQGDLVVRLIPRAEALGCSVFALRAMQNVEAPWGVICNAREPGAASSSAPGVADIIGNKFLPRMRPATGG